MIKEKLAKYLGIESDSFNRFIQDQQPSQPVQQRKVPKRGSVVRHAIGLLIQHPYLVKAIDDIPQLSKIKIKGTTLLQSLIDQVRQQPEITSAQLIERWRQTPQYPSLLKLAAWQHGVEDDNLEPQFIDTIVKIINKHLELRLEQLAHKSRVDKLTSEERLEYAQLIQNEL